MRLLSFVYICRTEPFWPKDRMPIPLGEFISHNVYNKKLRSVHKTCDPSCVVFIDAWKGKEEQVGTSWVVCSCQSER